MCIQCKIMITFIDKPVYYLIVDDSKLNINVCVASYLCFNSYCCNVTRGGEEYNVPCKISTQLDRRLHVAIQLAIVCFLVQSDQYQNASIYTPCNYAHIELSMYFNVRHMAFIVCVIAPRNIYICKNPFIDGYIETTLLFTQTKQLYTYSQVCFFRLQISGCQSHSVI